jgi:hypothetical protein
LPPLGADAGVDAGVDALVAGGGVTTGEDGGADVAFAAGLPDDEQPAAATATATSAAGRAKRFMDFLPIGWVWSLNARVIDET